MKFLTRRLLALGTPLLFTACATIAPPQPPSLELPKPPSDLRAVRKGERVILTWTIPSSTTDRQTVHTLGATRICRGVETLTECGVPVGLAAPTRAAGTRASGARATGSYTDTLPSAQESDNASGFNPSAFITYAVEVLNTDGRDAGLSNQVRAPLARTLAPPADFSARVTSQGVALTWTSGIPSESSPAVHYVYRVYRRPERGHESILAGESAGSERDLALTDSSIEWESTYEYHVEAVTVVAQKDRPELQVEGDDSPQVKVFAHDIFPPAVPSGLQAVFSGPGQQRFIDLIWAPVADVDLDGYNVYRHEEGAAPVRVNAQVVKTPAYRDTDVEPGKKYFYSVSAVDVRGNESARSEEASESVP